MLGGNVRAYGDRLGSNLNPDVGFLRGLFILLQQQGDRLAFPTVFEPCRKLRRLDKNGEYWFSTPENASGSAVLSNTVVADAISLAACEIGLISFPCIWPKTTSRNVPVYHSPSMGMPCGPSRL